MNSTHLKAAYPKPREALSLTSPLETPKTDGSWGPLFV